MKQPEKNKHAQALSALGCSKGGKTRAANLSAEELSAIGRLAAEKRWESKHIGMPKETHTGILRIGCNDIPCSVLDNGMRVFSTRGITRAMGGKKTGAFQGEIGAPRLPPFLASEAVNSFINKELMVRLLTPIPFRPQQGGKSAYGYEATLLPKICKVILDASHAGKLKKNQEYLAKTADVLLCSFAEVGVIALIDEATGYQADRARDELVKILEAYIMPELRPWTRRFPPEFFEGIYNLNGWEFIPSKLQRPQYVGKLINQLVYRKLPEGVLEELQKKNPIQDNGHRLHKHHQFLTPEIGNAHLDKQISAVMVLMRAAAGNKKQFFKLFNIAFPTMESATSQS